MSGPNQGDVVPTLSVQITRADLVRYAGASDDYVRQHWDHPFMIDSGFPDVIVHGWLTFAHMCRAVTEWLPPDHWQIADFDVRYIQPTYPGSILCGGEVVAVDANGVRLELWGKTKVGETTTRAKMTMQRIS